MPNVRQAKLFRNGRNQAVRIPVEWEMPGSDVVITRDGEKLIIQPVRKRGLIAFLESRGDHPEDREFPEIERLPATPEPDL
jgi:antitoxin VapB